MYSSNDLHLYGLIVWEGQANQCQGVPLLLVYAIQKGFIEGTELPDNTFTNKGQTVPASLITKNYTNHDTGIQTLILHVFNWWGIVPISECKNQWQSLLDAHLGLLRTMSVPSELLTDLSYQNLCKAAHVEPANSFKVIAKLLSEIQAKADEHYVNALDDTQ